jgi:hypothetical protein
MEQASSGGSPAMHHDVMQSLWHHGCMSEQVEAEEVEDLAERYDVSAVPHFIMLKVRLPDNWLRNCQMFTLRPPPANEHALMSKLSSISLPLYIGFAEGWQGGGSNRGR